MNFSTNNFDLTFSCMSDGFPFNLIQFSEILSVLSNELHIFHNFQTIITPINDESLKSALCMEIKALLQEMDCPYLNLFEGLMENKILNQDIQLILIRYLCTEIAATRIIAVENSQNYSCPSKSIESNLSEIIKPVLDAVDLHYSDISVTCNSIFNKIESRVCEKLSLVTSLLPPGLILTDHQWRSVDILISAFNSHYRAMRANKLIRYNPFIQNPKPSKDNSVKDTILERYHLLISKWESTGDINLVDLLAARNIAYTDIYKTGRRDVGTCKIKKIVNGPVPDRGGRTLDIDATMMPELKKRKLK